MNDLIITIDRDTRKVKLNRGFIGFNGENLQGNIIADFTNKTEFVDGTAYFEVVQNGNKYTLEMEQDATNKIYSLPIKSSLLRYAGNLSCQVVIQQEETANGIPVFKSEVFQVPCLEAVNATGTIPEQYPSVGGVSYGEYPSVAIFRIPVGGATITLQNLDGLKYLDWGDGTVEEYSGEGEVDPNSHTYANNTDKTIEYTAYLYGVTRLGGNAFRDCTYLAQFNGSVLLYGVGSASFYGCTGLHTASFENVSYEANTYAFYGCTNLWNIAFPQSADQVAKYAFAHSGISRITLGDGVQAIREGAFEGCTELRSITIPASVVSIESKAFKGCSKLISLICQGDILEHIKTAKAQAENGDGNYKKNEKGEWELYWGGVLGIASDALDSITE